MGATQSTQHQYVLETSKGKLEGIEQRDLSGKPVLQRFAKIPYAQPPVGQLRWRRPQPLLSDFTFDQEGKPGNYTKFGPVCPQPYYPLDQALVDNPDAAPEIENEQDEDCLYLNVWVPAGTPPEGGWPVQFFIYGGWLQIGDPNQSNDYDPFDLLAHFPQRIIVAPTYRINVFGFAGGLDLGTSTTDPYAGNYGFWDQRLALEWTHTNISLFNGNPDLITVAGLSAGAQSTFLQLYHDTYLPPSRQIIKQIHLISNAIAIQPNPTTSALLTEQFNSVCEALSVSTQLPCDLKVDALRKVKWQDLEAIVPKLRYHTFRASTDGPIEQGGFLPPTFLATLHNGEFATKLAERGTRIMVGEVRDEALLYKLVNPPSNHSELVTQLNNYYPMPVVKALLALPVYNVPDKEDTSVTADQWASIFAEIVADGQVHASERGLVKALLDPPRHEGVKAVPSDRVFRYRICWRAKGLDNWIKPEAGLCHAADTPIWWASGYRAGFAEEDKKTCQEFLAPYGRYLRGEEDIGWGGNGAVDEVRLIDEQGNVREGWKDELWEKGLTVYEAVWQAQNGRTGLSTGSTGP